MRILHTSDLHFRVGWFQWLSHQATRFDACCVSGDMLDMFDFTSLVPQVRWVRQWAKSFPGHLYLCSGNHDWWVEDRIPDPLADGRWLQSLRRPGVWVDGDANALPGYALQCQPWVGTSVPCTQDQPIIVVAHAPPTGLPVSVNCDGDDVGDFETDVMLQVLPPGSIILSGHTHSPRQWHAKRRGVTCFNPGFADEKEPNHIILDTTQKVAAYYQSGQLLDTYTWGSRSVY